MSKNVKYIASMGLGFAEEKEMKKLGKLAKEGWIFDNFEKLSYKLVKGEPQNLIYCVDYNENKDDLDSYIELIEESGWTHVTSYEGFHFFKAPEGTHPIYSDGYTLGLKYRAMNKSVKKTAIYSVVIAIIVGLITYIMENIAIDSNVYEGLKFIVYMIAGGAFGFFIALIPCSMCIKSKMKKAILSAKN